MTKIRNFKKKHPRAYINLRDQLRQGGRFKTFGVAIIIELGRWRALTKVPIIGDLVETMNGLLAGHVSDIELIDSANLKHGVREIVRQNIILPEVLEVDVLIIGSGPGAAVATEIEMHNSGSNICVIERGSYPRTPEKLHHSLTHVINDFFQAGQEMILAPGFPLYAQGNVLGGGSEVNSGLYHKLPEQYRDKYSHALGISLVEWLESEFETESFLMPEKMKVSPNDSVLSRGVDGNNLICENVPRWRTYAADGTYVHRGMNRIFWNNEHVQNKIKLYHDSNAIHIATENKKFLEVTVQNTHSRIKTKIRAHRIHLAGGAISTPNLLAKSNLIGWGETEFSWHPMNRIVASTVSSDLGAGDIDPFQAWTPDRSLKFGSAVSTAPLLSVALGRHVSILEASKLRSFYSSFSSSGKGGILPHIGMPWYKFSEQDRRNADSGISMLTKIITQGGGTIINLEKINSRKFSTVHIFGTLPIGSAIFIKGSNQLCSDDRIRVSDASILPFGPGVNPQGVVMTTVRLANRNLVSK